MNFIKCNDDTIVQIGQAKSCIQIYFSKPRILYDLQLCSRTK